MFKTTPKYKAVKTIVDGIKFDSKLEAKCYEILKESGLKFALQPSFLILPPFTYQKKTIRGVVYKADFMINDTIIVDVKGMETPVFKLKLKMMIHKGHTVTLIKSQKQMRQLIDTIKNNI